MHDISELRNEAAHTAVHGVWTKGGPVYARLSDDTVQGLHGKSVATFGDAATLGMWAFATGIWITGMFQANILPSSDVTRLFPLLLVYSGIVLFIAGLFLYGRNNTFLGSMFCSFGAFNLSRGVLVLCVAVDVFPRGAVTDVLQGCLMESFAYIALSLLAGALRMNGAYVLTLVFTWLGFSLAGLPFLVNSIGAGGWGEAGEVGGYLMLAAGLFAYYAGTALLVNAAWERPVLPIGGQA
jgi:succinate-acetate transporter protein